MLEWATHLKHLQSILLEYDPIRVPSKPTMLKYFQEGLRPFILAKLQNQDLKLESFVQMVKKTVVAEAKPSLRPWASVQEIDPQCFQGIRPASTTAAKASNQGNSQG